MQIFSEARKQRLKIAAGLLRKGDAHFEKRNFYEAVIDAVNNLDGAKREGLEDMIDWLMSYELAETIYCDTAPLLRVRKTKTRFNR